MRHIPVLKNEIYSFIKDNISQDVKLIDCNFGDGGHSQYFLEQDNTIKILAIDADIEAIKRAKIYLGEKLLKNITIVNDNFKNLDNIIYKNNFIPNVILYDLGLSTYQLNGSGKGFSFKYDEPLNMGFGVNPNEFELNAYDIINTWSKENLALIFKNYADEKKSWIIANIIEKQREMSPIKTTFELAKLIEENIYKDYKSGIHPATRVFQALRIAVNDELQVLEKSLNDAVLGLNNGGIIAVISYHSLEDIIVKKIFKEYEDKKIGKRLNKKVIIPSEFEIKNNIKSRSAKLRIFKKNEN